SRCAVSDEGADGLLLRTRARGRGQESPSTSEPQMSLPDHSGTRPGATPEPIDPGVIEGLRELGGAEDPGLLVELIDLYLADAPLRMAEIEQSLASGDWKLLERAAHTLKSASANIGALGLS